MPVAKLNDATSSQVACLLKEEREKYGLSLRITSVLEVDLEKIISKARKVAAKQK